MDYAGLYIFTHASKVDDKLRDLARAYLANPDKYGRNADELALSDDMTGIADLVVEEYNKQPNLHLIPTQEERKEIAIYIASTRFPEVLKAVEREA